ncbi:MAG: hypothetical protein ACE5LV_07870 [Candidatus Aminicenantales bacterium]
MRKTAWFILTAGLFSLVLSPGFLQAKDSDIQTIRKAVLKNSGAKTHSDLRWFKLTVTENRTKKIKIRLTLPLSLIELLMACTKGKELKIECDEGTLDLRKLFQELKKAGPMSVIEISDEDETLKVWFE